MRDGLSLLDQAVAFGGKSIVHEDLEALLGAVPQELLRAMIQAITAQDSAAALHVLAQLLDQGHDLRAYCADVVEYLRNMLVVSVTSQQEWAGLIEASTEDLMQLASDKGTLTPEQLQQIFTLFTQAEDALRLSAHPRFVLEAAAVKATRLLRREAGNVTQPGRVTPSERPPQPPSFRTDKTPATERAAVPSPPATSSRPTSPAPKPSPPSGPASKGGGEASGRPVRSAVAEPAKPLNSAPTATPRPPQAVVLNWERFQEEVGHAFPNIAPFLEMGRLVMIEGNVVTIGFAKQAGVARSMLEKPDNIQALASLCERLSGQPVRLRVVELTEADPPGPTMAQIRAAKEQEQKVVLFERAKAHPVVKQALEIFGAELADVRAVSNQKEVQE
jgi:DNA polymerase-3 subunit gamma/tau